MTNMPEWLDKMADIVGRKGFSCSSQEMEPWLTDWRGRYTGSAQAMISPTTTEQVSGVVKIAGAHDIAIVPQGGNSGMVGGATPDKSGKSILLSLRRMNKIREITTEDRLAVCEAGVILQNFHDALAECGQRFPLTLGGKGSATMGGLVSTNAGGTQVLRHGTMRALVSGLEAVLPNGSIYSRLSALRKDNRGYDLKQLLIGGEGTLGIVTAVTLKTVPAVIDRCVAWVGVSSPQKAYDLFKFLNAAASHSLEGFEIIPRSCLDGVLQHIPGTRSPLVAPCPWNVLIEIVRDRASDLDPQGVAERLLEKAIDTNIANDAVLAVNEAQADAFWKLRDSIAEAERAHGPALQHDISVPVGKMAEFICSASPEIEKKYAGTKVAAFGHMGDGNVHFHVKAPQGVNPSGWMEEYSKKITPTVHDLVIAVGGSISAEHGIGQNKRAELGRLSNEAELSALYAIKTALDPQNIFNPGKLVPLASERRAF